MTHAHITAWVLGLVLFFVTISMKGKGRKGTHMSLRLFYILIIVTGGILFSGLSSIPGLYYVKGIVGLWLIFLMEFIAVRGPKGMPTRNFWIQFAVALVLVLYLGFSLPQGFNWF